jgi:hypothetical protein
MNAISQFIKQRAIDTLGALLSDSKAFENVKLQVKIAEDPNKSGSEKKEAVMSALSSLGYTLAGWLMNVLIELAVSYFRVRSNK